MAEENISQEFRLKNIDETRNYFVEELMRKRHKKSSTTLNYIEYFLMLSSKVTGCISINNSNNKEECLMSETYYERILKALV